MWRKIFNLLSAAMDGCFQKNSFHGKNQSRWDEAASMLEGLKQLDAALGGVMSEWKLEHLSMLGKFTVDYCSQADQNWNLSRISYCQQYSIVKGKRQRLLLHQLENLILPLLILNW